MPGERPEIPEPMKREVRQRCGFGCVVCGFPLYEYEHMEGWAKVQRHVASEITLLCRRHHGEKTDGLLPVAVVREADQNPHNKRSGVSHPLPLHYSGTTCTVVIGGNLFHRYGGPFVDGSLFVAIAIDMTPLLMFHFEQGQLLLTFQVFNEKGERILWVDRNELRYCTSSWDIRREGRTLTIREGLGAFILEVEFTPPDRIEVRRGRFGLNGLGLLIEPDTMCYVNGGQCFSNCGFSSPEAAILVGTHQEGIAAIHLPERDRGQPDWESAARMIRDFRQSLKKFGSE